MNYKDRTPYQEQQILNSLSLSNRIVLKLNHFQWAMVPLILLYSMGLLIILSK